MQAEGYVLAGHSAGGHLAMVELQREALAAARGARRPMLGAVCSISGIYDLAPIRLGFQQPVLRISEEEVTELSPLRRAPAAAPPVMLAVGGEETPEFIRQQNALAALWQALDLRVDSMKLAGRDHFTVVDSLSSADHPLTRWLIEACLAASCRRRD